MFSETACIPPVPSAHQLFLSSSFQELDDEIFDDKDEIIYG